MVAGGENSGVGGLANFGEWIGHFDNDAFRLAALVVACGTIMVVLVGPTAIKAWAKNKESKRQYALAEQRLQQQLEEQRRGR